MTAIDFAELEKTRKKADARFRGGFTEVAAGYYLHIAENIKEAADEPSAESKIIAMAAYSLDMLARTEMIDRRYDMARGLLESAMEYWERLDRKDRFDYNYHICRTMIDRALATLGTGDADTAMELLRPVDLRRSGVADGLKNDEIFARYLWTEAKISQVTKNRRDTYSCCSLALKMFEELEEKCPGEFTEEIRELQILLQSLK